VAAATAGGAMGAASGAIKGMVGIGTHNAGAKTGAGVGKSINATSSAVKKITGGDKKDNTPGSPASSGSGSSLVEGTISNANTPGSPASSGSGSSYLSGVPGSSDKNIKQK
ncbi:MAG: hypothetical protein JXQ68_08085, partial [Campylobacterales bacterium]|nr:hypothetical protein [Campylobacterales bacterium]